MLSPIDPSITKLNHNYETKHRRRERVESEKTEKSRARRLERKKRKKDEAKGNCVVEKQRGVTKTIESMRVPNDNSMKDPKIAAEIHEEQMHDEFSSLFAASTIKQEENQETVAVESPLPVFGSDPKIFVTVSQRARNHTVCFAKELCAVIPNCTFVRRHRVRVKPLIEAALAQHFTCMLLISEDVNLSPPRPASLIVAHLPDGPTLHFRLTHLRMRRELARKQSLEMRKTMRSDDAVPPQVVTLRFSTVLGNRVERCLQSLFPIQSALAATEHGRVVTFCNSRDYILFRHQRIILRRKKQAKVQIQELGPSFTLRLRSVQKGRFDPKFGNFEWVYQRREDALERRKFFL